MANLIVTIIGIALIAVAAVMGVFYGGTAFEQASINAYAAQTINVMQQVKAAYTMAEMNGDTNNFYNNPTYLDLEYYSNWQSYNINYGSAGNLLDWGFSGPGSLSGAINVWSGLLQIQTDSNGNAWVVFMVNNPVNSTEIKFYAQLCEAINQQMGQIPYSAGTVQNNWESSGISLPGANMGDAGGAWAGVIQPNTPPNLCAYDALASQVLVFAIPI